MNHSRWKSLAPSLGLAGSGASALTAIVFVLQHSLNQTEWFVLMALAILGFCSTAIAAWVRSLWWLTGTVFSLALIIGLVGAVGD